MSNLSGIGWLGQKKRFGRKLLSLTFYLLLFTCNLSFGQNQAEYFFDTDPGVGNGTNLSVSAGDSVSISRSISIGNLSSGFHTLYVRTRMNGRWSFPASSPFFIQSLGSLSTGPITSMEYFFNTDPGAGNGIPLSVSPAVDSSVRTAVIPIGSLATGFHTLYIRAKNNSGYSLTEARTFFIVGSGSLNAGPISSFEYFFDNDPGVGSGTQINVSPAADSVARTAVIPIGSLTSGFHTLYIRAKNNFGYSLTEARTFFIVGSGSLNAGPITSFEYFFDTDPGPGNGTRINVNPTADSIDRTAVIPIGSLSAGFHTLYIRSKNSFGYSQTEARTFFITTSAGTTAGPVNRMEYFIDADPGPGNGLSFPAFASADSVDRTFVLAIPANLGQGSHKLYIRSQNADKRWSLTEVQDFTVDCGEIFIQAANNPICPSQGTVLSPTLGLSGTFQWYRNNVLIPNATEATFFASQAGSYTLSYANGSCADTSDALVLTESSCPALPGSGNAPSFTGGNSLISFPLGSVTAYTIECWVKFTGNPANRSLVVHTVNGPFNNWSHQIRTNAQGQFVHYTAAPGAINTQGTTVAQQNQWYHVAITASNGGQGRLYVNGIAEGAPFNVSSLWASGVEYQIGSGSAGVGLDQASSPVGQIDEVRIWNTAMTEAQIRERMCRKVTAADPLYSNLLRYFNFDETAGNTSVNLTNPAVTANWVNNSTRATSGAPIGNQSVAAYVSSGLPSASLSFNGQDNFAVNYTGGTGGSTSGTHVYVVIEKPNTEAGIDNPESNNRYFGVFNVNISNPQYTAVYNYNGNPFVTTGNKPNLALFKRTDNSFSPWANAGAVNNTNANTLTVTGQSTEYMIGVTTSAITAGVIGNNQSFDCATAPPALLENLVSATTTSGNPITYQWQDSTANGSWQTIQNATNATFQPPFLTISRWYRRRASAGSLFAFSNQVEILVQQAIAGDPTVFPENAWHVYGYNGGDLNLSSGTTYRGFYSVNSLNINTQNQWGGNASPSAAANYQGCSINNDNFTFVLKRKGFSEGNYLLNIVDHDDNIRVYLDGNVIFEHLGCCDGHPNITLGRLDANSTLEVRVQEGIGFAQVNLSFTESDLQAGVISGNQNICGSSAPAAFASTQHAFGGPSLTITYQWQDSTAGGTWQNIVNSVNATFQASTLSETTWFRRIAINGNQQAISNEVQVTVSNVVGDPSIFPNNQWNMYAYSGGDFDLVSGVTYLGFYPVLSLNVNSANQWNINTSPSSAPGYQGCPVPNDNFIFTLKRRGFPAGQYTMNIITHDDWVRVLVDGVQVFEHIGCCDSHNGIDLGTLGANSTIEVRTLEGGGSAQIAFELVTSDFQGGEIAANQSICSGKAPALISSVAPASGGGAVDITYQWQDSTAAGTWQNITNATGLTFQPGPLSASRWYRRRANSGNLVALSNEIAITVLATPEVTVAPAGPITLCEGELAQLTATATQGSTLQWLRNGALIGGQISANLFVTQAGTYRAVSIVGGQCTDTSNAVVVNVNPKPAPKLNLSGPQSICSNGSLTLIHTNPQTGHTNQWKRDGSPISGGNSIIVSQPGFYYLVSTITATGCKDSTEGLTLNVVNPVITPAGPVQNCQGETANLTATNIGTGTLKWLRNEVEIPGANSQTLTASLAGVYKVVVELPGLCTDTSAGTTLIVNPLPQAAITAEADSFCVGSTIVLSANTGNGLSYQWKRNGQNIANATAETLSVSTPGSYTVEVRNSFNCTRLSEPVEVRQVNNIAWFLDVDGDGYGTGNTVQSCTRPPNGFLPGEIIATTGDCNDLDPTINPARQFFSYVGTPGFDGRVISPVQGTPYTTFRFEVIYTDLNNNPPPVTFPRVILDYEGDGQLNGPRDRTILMQEFNTNDKTYSDGKRYFATVNSLPSGQNYTTRIVSNIGTCGTLFGPFEYPDVFILSDLQIFANDISFSNPNPAVSSPLTVSATVHNVSDFASENFVMHLVNQFDTNIVYPDIVVPFLAPHTSTTVHWNITTPAVPAWCPMQVYVDWTNVIEETNELDNSAIRPFVNGNFNVPGNITFGPSVSPSTVVGVQGASVTLTGSAIYTETAVPLQNPSVAGAQVTFTIQPGGQTFTTYTNASGQISFSFLVSLTPGVYTITGTITDFTLTTTFTTTFIVVPPVCLPDLVATLTVSSENIVEGESITGTLRVRNVGCQDVTDSTLVRYTQSGGSPIIPQVKIGPLAIGEFVELPIGNITFASPGTFSICGLADADFEVEEAAEFNNQACRVITVIPFLPDIFPINCGVGGQMFLTGQPSNITVSLANSGGSATGPFNVRVQILQDGNLVETINQNIPNLARQSQTSFTFQYTYPAPGNYSLQVYCDTPEPNGVVAETNETNNGSNCSILILAPQADLFFGGGCENIDVDPNDPVFPGNVTIKARLFNGGNATANAPILVRFTQSGGAVHEVTLTENLPAGQSVMVSKLVPAVAPATETISVVVDPDNTIPEFSEANNSAGPKSLCHEFAPIDNLCGGNWWNSTYLINQAIFLNVPVNVEGVYDASQLKVRFLVSGPGLTGTLNLGDAILTNVSELCGCPITATLPVSFAFPQEGEYTFTFVTDPDNEYTECNETNNVLVRKAIVTGLPDMRVLSQMINPSRLNPDVDEPITIQATYENIGMPNVDQTMKFKLLVDEVPVDSATVNGLVTSDNFTVNFSRPWSSNVVGAHIIRTIIDADQEIMDANRANNEATRAVIVGAAANLYFQVFVPSNGSPSIGQQISILARVGNNGDEDVNALVRFFYVNDFNDTIQIGQVPVFVAGNDSLTINFPWTVVDNNTVLIGKIVNADIMEFNYDDNLATAQIGGFALSFATTPACANKPNGTISLTVTGGNPPFEVRWSNGFIGQVLTAGAGSYQVSVKDASGVEVTGSATISALPGLRYFLDADGDGYGNPALDSIDCVQPQGYVRNSLDCNDADSAVYKNIPKPAIASSAVGQVCQGSPVTLSVVNPLSQVTYTWSNGETGASIVINTSGRYAVTASQDSGCTAFSDSIDVEFVTGIVPTVATSTSQQGAICRGTSVTFTATVSGQGAQPGLAWLLNNVVVAQALIYTTDSLHDGDAVHFQLTSSESCVTQTVVNSDTLTISVADSVQADAGPDQNLCGTTTQLSANALPGTTGMWTVTAGTAQFADETNPQTQVSGLSTGLNRLQWRLSNGICPATTDEVDITVTPGGVVANAGPDQVFCETDTARLAAQTPVSGTGTWSFVTGSGQISDANKPDALVEQLAYGENKLLWTVIAGNCEPLTDTLVITRYRTPSLADAGSNQTICTNQTMLAATTPLAGNGVWTVLSGTGILSDSTLPNSGISNLSLGLNELVWTVSNGTCEPSADTLRFTVAEPLVANAGPDQTVCGDETILAANTPASGNGAWTILTGTATLADTTLPNAQVSNLSPGLNELLWTVSNSLCQPAFDTVRITAFEVPVANAGSNQTICTNQTVLAATTPLAGNGVWTVLSGTGILSDSTLPNSGISNLSLGLNELVWTVSNGTCEPSADTLSITVAEPLVANAGPDQTVCGITASLGAQAPPTGSGRWTLISGAGNVSNTANPNAQVIGLLPGPNVFQWRVSNGVCPSDSATVTITSVQSPSIAQAGTSQTVCGTSVQMAANQPATGTGVWRLISGTGVIADSLSPNTVVTQLSLGENTFRWTIRNAPCPSSSDDVVITANEIPVANAGRDTIACDTLIRLGAVVSGGVSGTWTQIVGSGRFVAANDPNTFVLGLNTLLNRFVWTTTLGTCSASDTVNVFVVNERVSLGSDTTICLDSTLVLRVPPGFANYVWSTGQTGNTITVNQTGTYYVTVTTPEGCNYSDTIAVTVTVCTGTKPLAANMKVQVQPNPFRQHFMLEAKNVPTPAVALRLVNLKGSIVYQDVLNANQGSLKQQIQPGDLPAGMYILELQTGERVYRRKLVME